MWDLKLGKHYVCTLTDNAAAQELLGAFQKVEGSLFQADPAHLVEVDRGEVEKPKRKRRTKVEMEAARAEIEAAADDSE